MSLGADPASECKASWAFPARVVAFLLLYGHANRHEIGLADLLHFDRVLPAGLVLYLSFLDRFNGQDTDQDSVQQTLAYLLRGGQIAGTCRVVSPHGGQLAQHDHAGQQKSSGQHHFQQRESGATRTFHG